MPDEYYNMQALYEAVTLGMTAFIYHGRVCIVSAGMHVYTHNSHACLIYMMHTYTWSCIHMQCDGDDSDGDKEP